MRERESEIVYRERECRESEIVCRERVSVLSVREIVCRERERERERER